MKRIDGQKKSMIKGLITILAIGSVNAVNHVMLENM